MSNDFSFSFNIFSENSKFKIQLINKLTGNLIEFEFKDICSIFIENISEKKCYKKIILYEKHKVMGDIFQNNKYYADNYFKNFEKYMLHHYFIYNAISSILTIEFETNNPKENKLMCFVFDFDPPNSFTVIHKTIRNRFYNSKKYRKLKLSIYHKNNSNFEKLFGMLNFIRDTFDVIIFESNKILSYPKIKSYLIEYIEDKNLCIDDKNLSASSFDFFQNAILELTYNFIHKTILNRKQNFLLITTLFLGRKQKDCILSWLPHEILKYILTEFVFYYKNRLTLNFGKN